MMGGMGSGPSLLETAGMLLRADEVQKEIELLDDQKAKLKAFSDELRAEMEKQRDQYRDLSPEERMAKFNEARKEYGAKVTAKVNEILLPHQVDRVKELAVQRLGLMALGDPDVQEKLKISEDQKEKMKAVRESISNTMREMFAGMRDLDEEARRKKFGEIREKMDKIRSETEAKVLDILTSEQKGGLEKMKGKKFDFPEGMGFGGSGGRRGPGGPGGPRRD